MSKYWKKMEIWRKDRQINKEAKEDELFISQERPAFFVNKGEYTVKNSFDYNFNENEIKEISDFYSSKYRIGKSNNTIRLSPLDIQRYLNLNSFLLTMYIQNKLMGSIISVVIPVKISTDLKIKHLDCTDRANFFKSEKENLIFCSTSFLILDDKYRKKGLGMGLIQESLQKLYDNGGLGAYFINSISRCENSIPLYTWYFPLNLNKLDNCNFNYPKDHKYIFELAKKESVKVTFENSEEALFFYRNYLKDKKITFTPSLEYWQKWIISFPTFLVYSEKEIIGLFSFNMNDIAYPSNRVIVSTGILIICVGKQPETLQTALYTAKNIFDILHIHETGDLNNSLLSSIFAQKSHKSNINFFNTKISLNSSNFYVPLF